MGCSNAGWVAHFVAGALAAEQVPAMEEHVEHCQECFLRMVAAADEISGPARSSLGAHASSGSRLDRWLNGDALVDGQLEGGAAGDGSPRKTVGPYVVTGLLGAGGMGVVYRAKHPVSGLEVAVKTVRTPYVASFLGMLRQEIEFLREARHPAIVSVLDSDLVAEEPWYAMELFEGPTLQAFNRMLWERGVEAEPAEGEGGPPRRPAAGGRLVEVLRLFAQLCEPLGFIHKEGMVHGDLKPSNVFLRDQQTPVLMDFGLASKARGTVGREALDVTGRVRGTLPYIAPEVIRGRIPDARADMYALGCMLYETILGTPPFISPSGGQIIDMHLSAAPTAASVRASGVPPELDDLLLRLLAKRPAERFGHATALGASLAAIADALVSPLAARSPVVISSEATVPLFRPPMVGRDSELRSVLESVHEAVRSSSGTILLVSGESGIGKTFFAAEVAQRAMLEGIQVVTSECLPLAPTREVAAHSTTPLQGFRRFFETLRDRCHERGRGEVERIFGGNLPLLTGYLPMLEHLRRARDSEADPPALPASAARERIVAAVVDTIAAYASSRSLLLAIDDLQWADDLTLAVLERLDDDLFRRIPLLVMGTYRDDEISEGIRRIGDKPVTRTLHLGRLDRGDIGAIVGGMLSLAAPPEALVNYVHVHAEGIPFFAAEYLRTLVAAGALVYRAGSWSASTMRLGDLSEGQGRLPKTLQALIRTRLDRLTPASLRLLEAGAVLGREFSLSLLARMTGRPEGELAAILAATVAAQITRSDGLDGYAFLHDKIREALYAGLPVQRRAALHLDAARAMEGALSVPPELWGQIGHHLRSGGERLRAIDYLEKAGVHALQIGANVEADRLFQEVLELDASASPSQPTLRRARWLRQRGDALVGLGKMAEGTTHLKESAALLGRPFPAGKGDFARQLMYEILVQVAHRLRPSGIRRLRADDAEVNAETVRIFERMHEASFYLGRDADLILSTTVSLNSAERGGPTPSLAIVYANAAMMAGVLPIPKLADRYFQLATTAAAAAPDLSAESWLLEMEGIYRGWRGERARAIECLEGAIELAHRGSFARRVNEAASVRVCVDLYGGRHASVLASVGEVEQSARRRRDVQIQCWALLEKAEAYLIRGEVEAALAEITSAGSQFPSVGRPEKIWAVGLEAYARNRRGDRERALALIDEGIELASRGPAVHSYCLGGFSRLAETAVEICRESRGEAAFPGRAATAHRACAILKRATRVFPIAIPAAALLQGTLDLVRGRRRPAAVAAAWRSAADTAARLELPFPELRLRVALAELARPGRSEPEPRSDRIRSLAELLKLEPPTVRSPGPLPSERGVKVEREGQRPFL
ncbi:MAG TPA: protein kinase [Polyangia bacterium]|nr:protein kinase [Polyangia bacterium]